MKYFLIFLFCLGSYVQHVCADSPAEDANQAAQQGDSFQRGLAALKENRLEDAFEAFTVAEREHPGDARVRNFRGILLVRKMPIAISAFSGGPNTRFRPPAKCWNAL
jgi:hypothetical protein